MAAITPDDPTQASGRRDPSVAKMLRRGLTKRCGVCGERRIFRRWFTMVDECPKCGLKFEREPGAYIGAIGINTVVSFGALLITLVVLLVVTYPDPPAVPLIAAGLAVAVLVPLLFYPFSRTIWLAIDLSMNPLRSGEVKMPYGPHEDRPPNEPGDNDLPPSNWG